VGEHTRASGLIAIGIYTRRGILITIGTRDKENCRSCEQAERECSREMRILMEKGGRERKTMALKIREGRGSLPEERERDRMAAISGDGRPRACE